MGKLSGGSLPVFSSHPFVSLYLIVSLKIEVLYELFFSDFRVGINLRFSGISDACESYMYYEFIQSMTAVT